MTLAIDSAQCIGIYHIAFFSIFKLRSTTEQTPALVISELGGDLAQRQRPQLQGGPHVEEEGQQIRSQIIF
jgi:hypothetical protein